MVGFLFLELVWGQTGFGLVALSPRDIAIATLVYSAITFTGDGAVRGRALDRPRRDVLAVLRHVRQPLPARGARRPAAAAARPLAGATKWALPAGSLALVLVAIGGTTFDGAQEGVLKDAIKSLFRTLPGLRAGRRPTPLRTREHDLPASPRSRSSRRSSGPGSSGCGSSSASAAPASSARLFAHAFIPIALAYLVAHYFSYFYLLQQAQFGYLLSDPLGHRATDLFGTADNGIDLSSISAGLVQWVQFGAIVTGHVIALALGHDRALKIWGNTRDAAWSQVWMLVMMMFFSVLGLYLLSQANA